MRGLRVKLIIIFFTSLIFSIIIGIWINGLVRNEYNSYDNEIKNFTSQCKEIENKISKAENDKEISSIIDDNDKNVDIFIIDNNGGVLIKNKKSMEKSFDLNELMRTKASIDSTEYKVKYNIIDRLDNNKYILFSGILNKGDNATVVFGTTIICFIVLFLLLTKNKLDYIKELRLGLKEISKGDLSYKVRIVGKDELSEIGKSINDMSQRLYKNNKKEKEIERNKELFIINMSHDLRTPLTSIIGYVNLLKEKYKNEDDMKKYIDIIDLKSARLDKLISDFFEYNKLTNCEVELNKINISINEFLRQVITGIMPLCNDKNLKIKLLFPSYDISVCIDPDKMFRVMENLLANAIRYSNKESEIEVTLTKEKSITIITIANECNEFNKEEIDKIFDRFYRGDKSRNTVKGGAGLGLAIAKSIVKLHNGDIVAEYNQKKICIKMMI
jgi:signal transduction histidine kinase